MSTGDGRHARRKLLLSALKKIGQPFEQVQNQFSRTNGGSGLGLAISRSLTELHGGTMRIRSREGVGTIISLRIPGARKRLPADIIKLGEARRKKPQIRVVA